MSETRGEQDAVRDIAGEAEAVVKTLNRRSDRQGREQIQLTKSQIRKFLAAVNALTNKVAVHRTQSGQTEDKNNSIIRCICFHSPSIVRRAGRRRS